MWSKTLGLYGVNQESLGEEMCDNKSGHGGMWCKRHITPCNPTQGSWGKSGVTPGSPWRQGPHTRVRGLRGGLGRAGPIPRRPREAHVRRAGGGACGAVAGGSSGGVTRPRRGGGAGGVAWPRAAPGHGPAPGWLPGVFFSPCMTPRGGCVTSGREARLIEPRAGSPPGPGGPRGRGPRRGLESDSPKCPHTPPLRCLGCPGGN